MDWEGKLNVSAAPVFPLVLLHDQTARKEYSSAPNLLEPRLPIANRIIGMAAILYWRELLPQTLHRGRLFQFGVAVLGDVAPASSDSKSFAHFH